MSNKSGYIVKTKTGKIGVIYSPDANLKGKAVVHLLDENKSPTGLKMLCDPNTIQLIGFND